MVSDTNSHLATEKIQVFTDLYQLEDFIIPENLQFSINDFSELTGCPCLFVDFKNRSINSVGCDSKLLLQYENFEEDLFSSISKLITDREDGCIELDTGDNSRCFFVPVWVKNFLVGYFVNGRINGSADEERVVKGALEEALPQDNLLSNQIEINIDKSKRFVRWISAQFEMSLELKNEVRKNQKIADELRLQKTFFENLFENSPDAILILDNEDKVLKANQEFIRLFEYTQDELYMNRVYDLIIPEKYKQSAMSATKRAVVGNSIDMRTVRQTKSGKQIHVQIIGKPIILENDQVAVYAIYRNMNQQVWNERSQKAVYGVSEILNSSLNSIEMIRKIEEELTDVIGSSKLFLELIAPNKRDLQVVNDSDTGLDNIKYNESLSSIVVKKKQLYYIDAKQIDEAVKLNRLSLKRTPKSWLGIPLMSEGKVLGVFGVYDMDYHSELNLESIKLLEVVAVQLASGIVKRLKEMELRMVLRSMEQSPASVIITDLKGHIEYVNPKFCEVSGYTVDEVLGRNPNFLKSGATSEEVYKELWNKVLNGKEWTGEFLNVKKNKELFWERASFSPIKDEYGEITHIIAVKEDITEAKNIEKELIVAKNKAEESDRLKSVFLANMSHELRTPLNAVIGFSNLCDESLPTEDVLDFVRLINKSGNQLLGIIEDILSFTSIESESFHINKEEFFMFNFVEDVKKMLKEKQVQKHKEHLKLQYKLDNKYSKILVRSDYKRLLQVVTNLTKNALKFTYEGFVEFGYMVNGKELVIYVKDTGVGIEKGKRDIIFERFRQVDDSITRTFGGTGLGLAICKKIMDMLGGTIEVESIPNKGSTFTIRLNCVISKEENQEQSVQLEKNDSKQPLILVVEDEESNFKLIQTILKRDGYQVIRAENGEEAVQMCWDYPDIRVVLMDIRMPVMDGFESTKAIKKFKPELPIIAQTAYAMDEDKDKAIVDGCDDYIAKPIKKELLLSKLESLINKSKKGAG